MISHVIPTLFKWHKVAASFGATLYLVLGIIQVANGIKIFDDGLPHSISDSVNDIINLRSSSSLTLPLGDYVIRPPEGSEWAIRLYMSSNMTAFGGEVIGSDAKSYSPFVANDYALRKRRELNDSNEMELDVNEKSSAGTGVHVGSASRAEFHSGTTVRGGNHLGSPSPPNSDASRDIKESVGSIKTGGIGGDAVVGQYFGSMITVHGGNFVAGRGTAADGYSLHISYDAQAHINGGNFRGAWQASDRGVIFASGCLVRTGNRLVGTLEDGSPLDIQVTEQTGGAIILNKPDGARCKTPDSSAKRTRYDSIWLSLLTIFTYFLQ